MKKYMTFANHGCNASNALASLLILDEELEIASQYCGLKLQSANYLFAPVTNHRHDRNRVSSTLAIGDKSASDRTMVSATLENYKVVT